MKKIIAIAAMSVFVLASCKKDYTCECTYSGNASGTQSTTVNGTKNDAKAACENGSSSANGTTITCVIK